MSSKKSSADLDLASFIEETRANGVITAKKLDSILAALDALKIDATVVAAPKSKTKATAEVDENESAVAEKLNVTVENLRAIVKNPAAKTFTTPVAQTHLLNASVSKRASLLDALVHDFANAARALASELPKKKKGSDEPNFAGITPEKYAEAMSVRFDAEIPEETLKAAKIKPFIAYCENESDVVAGYTSAYYILLNVINHIGDTDLFNKRLASIADSDAESAEEPVEVKAKPKKAASAHERAKVEETEAEESEAEAPKKAPKKAPAKKKAEPVDESEAEAEAPKKASKSKKAKAEETEAEETESEAEEKPKKASKSKKAKVEETESEADEKPKKAPKKKAAKAEETEAEESEVEEKPKRGKAKKVKDEESEEESTLASKTTAPSKGSKRSYSIA